MLEDWSTSKLSPIERLLLHKYILCEWIYFGVCVCRSVIVALILSRIMNGRRNEWKNIFIVNKNLAIDQWYNRNSPVFISTKRCSLLCGSVHFEFSFVFLVSSACSGWKNEVLNAFKQIKTHLDHFVLRFTSSSFLCSTVSSCHIFAFFLSLSDFLSFSIYNMLCLHIHFALLLLFLLYASIFIKK